MVERAVLVGTYIRPEARTEAESLLEELADLVDTLGIPVVGRELVHHRENHARYLTGSGKAEEVVQRVKALEADVLIFDNELTPSQQRNWEKLSGILVIDRQEVILDIFAKRAQTREARLQVDLARMEYSLPRLVRAWTHLGKQGGGIGAKGEGESQLEQDKRKIRGQIDRLKRELDAVKRQRATQRKDRKRTPVPNAAIVGYTNAGKSSLLRALTGADVLVEDKLFATLDTTTRKIALPNNQPLLLTDTVGFVRNLPHGLVEAFNATLEEAVMADFLIHVLDASQPEVMAFYETTRAVLGELGADSQRTLVVFNKIDRPCDPATLAIARERFPDAVFVSVRTGEGMQNLISRISELVADDLVTMELRVPQSRADLVARLYREADIRHTAYEGSDVLLRARVSPRAAAEFKEFDMLKNKPLKPFRSGEIWPDDKGVHINAHSGGILFHEGIYYWFGEHKIEGDAGNVAHVGVGVYSSSDLCNWKNEGIALRVSENPANPLHKGCIIERPKVLFNEKTGKFVMWFHHELEGHGYLAALSGVAVADEAAGPYTYLESFRPNAGVWPLNFPDHLREPLGDEDSQKLAATPMPGNVVPDWARDMLVRRDFEGGQMARDMTLFQDDDGRAYHVYASEENATLHLSLLSADFLKPAGQYVRIFPLGFNEAPAIFKRNGRYFLMTSGCTGWAPNAARLACADDILGPWTSLGNPVRGTEEQMESTFDSQSTFVLPVQGKRDAFVFMGDRWMPENAIDGRYIWLPLRFDSSGTPFLEWKDGWDLDAL